MTKYHKFQYNYNTCEEVYGGECGFKDKDSCENCELIHEDLRDEALMDFEENHKKRIATDVYEEIGSLDMANRYITITIESTLV